jgi:Flp pilus assembly protein TadB
MQRASLKTVAVLFVGSLLLLALARQGWAQESPKQQMNVNEIQLRAFAKAYVQLQKIRETYEPQLKEANDPEESKQIQIETLSKMQDVFKREGLTLESFSQIFEVTRTNKDLRQKLIEFINEER